MTRKIMAVGFVMILSLCCSAANVLSPSQRTWMTVDLVSGIVSYHDYDFTTATNVFNTEEYKSSKMAFRRIQAGDDYYVQNGAYTAQMTNSFYIGVFEVTAAQMSWMTYRLPTGWETREALRSVGKCNRTGIRGFSTSPAAFGANITEDSTLGRFNAYVQASNDNSRLVFDLPTEAMWEVAARAIDSSDETHSDWNWFFGKTADGIANYAFLKNDTTDDGYGNTSGARVPGARLPNAWGLYDVYGNHYDLCLDGADGNNSPECKQGNWTEATNIINSKQRTRGGSFSASTSNDANSLYRSYHDSGSYDDTGFRLARICTPEEEDYYTATWADEDGTPLGPAETYVAGRTPRYTGALPTKPSANGVDYYFAGWTPEPSRLVSNTVYRAVFHAAAKRTWMDLDLRSGIVTYHDYDFTTATNVFNTELYKTKRMAFRRVECGDSYFVQNGAYTAQMTNSYYIGLFEVTEAQYALMKNPAAAANGLKAQGKINRTAVRGVADAPAAFGADITAESPLGIMNANLDRRSCAKGVFDLPTEAMWEVAARAIDSSDETHSDWNWFFGKTADDIAQYAFLKNDTTDDGYGNTSGARVPGARLPNAWGLYDVYGNHYDLCLDGADGINSPECKQGNWTEATNKINTKQRTRGGSFSASTSNDANSLYRSYHDSGSYDDTGFRLARICTPEEEDYYTATWADVDGTPLGPAETCVAGRTPRYTGALPTKPSANGVDYYFAGWTPEPSRLVSNTVYRAVFHAAAKRTWMDLDLRSGIATYHDYDFTTATNVFNTELYKTKRMAFRRVECGDDYFVQNGAYTAQMTNSYYIGLFEVTEAQYALMKNPSAAANGLKAQGMINRTAVRGVGQSSAAFGADITPESPLGVMNANLDRRSCAKGVFDLPTEAMWEVAARAVDSADSTHSGWNWFFGKTSDGIANYAFLKNDTTDDGYGNTSGARVPGARLPNAWGLYDVYGNLCELCLDSADEDNAPARGQGDWTETPLALSNAKQRIRGGGAQYGTKDDCNSSYRGYHTYSAYADTGIRLAYICTPDEEDVAFVPESVTGKGNLYIPCDWFASFPSFVEKFGDDYPAAAVMPTDKTTADGSPAYVWQDFVNGCDPTNPEDVFRALIEMVDGVPCVSWEPNLNTNETLRIYRILGKADLADPEEDWARVRPGHRFFKVAVEMPRGTAVSDEPGPVDVEGDWEPNLQCHLSFDDSGNDGLNVLKVRGGDDAVVRTTQANVVAGLGAIQVVTDSSILAGLEPGDGAVYIPKGTHLALPIPGKLLNREGHPYTIKMKVRFPGFGSWWYSLLNMPSSNDSDNLVYLHNSSTPYIQLKLTNKGSGKGFDGSGGFTANQWEELTFQFGESVTKVFLNGTEIFSKDVALSTTYADCFDAGGYFLLSADDDGDDTAMYWADVKVYDGIVDP